MTRAARAGLAALAAAATACGAHLPLGRSARVGAPVAARVEDVPVCGFTVRVRAAAGAPEVEGELLATGPGGLWIATDAGVVNVAAAPGAPPRELVVTVGADQSAGLAAVTVLGSASTVTHGFFLVLSLPIWIATGTVTAVRSARGAYADGAADDPELAAYARFPQGLPAAAALAALHRCRPEPRAPGAPPAPPGAPDAPPAGPGFSTSW